MAEAEIIKDVEFAVVQTINLCHRGQKQLAVRTFCRLLRVVETPDVKSALRGLLYVAEHHPIEQFEDHLKLFARNHVPGYFEAIYGNREAVR